MHVPVDRRGKADSKANGFQVLQPSSRKRQNVIPLLQNIVHPDTQSSREWFTGSSSWDTRNWIQAVLALDPNQAPTRKGVYRPEKQQIYMESELKACWIGMEGEVGNDDNLRLILDINIHLDADAIFGNCPDIGADLMGLIFHSLIPSATSQHLESDSERRADSLRHFFACIRPAPPVLGSRSLQPVNMVSKLLPFQNRTVALLAQRERTQLGGHHDPQGFWTILQLGSMGKVAYRRTTGQLIRLADEMQDLTQKQKGKSREESPSEDSLTLAERDQLPVLLDLSAVRGTMLCEEMGASECQLACRYRTIAHLEQVWARQSKRSP